MLRVLPSRYAWLTTIRLPRWEIPMAIQRSSDTECSSIHTSLATPAETQFTRAGCWKQTRCACQESSGRGSLRTLPHGPPSRMEIRHEEIQLVSEEKVSGTFPMPRRSALGAAVDHNRAQRGSVGVSMGASRSPARSVCRSEFAAARPMGSPRAPFMSAKLCSGSGGMR